MIGEYIQAHTAKAIFGCSYYVGFPLYATPLGESSAVTTTDI